MGREGGRYLLPGRGRLLGFGLVFVHLGGWLGCGLDSTRVSKWEVWDWQFSRGVVVCCLSMPTRMLVVVFAVCRVGVGCLGCGCGMREVAAPGRPQRDREHDRGGGKLLPHIAASQCASPPTTLAAPKQLYITSWPASSSTHPLPTPKHQLTSPRTINCAHEVYLLPRS